MRVATFNVESFFERPKVLNTDSWSVGKPALHAFQSLNTVLAKPKYKGNDKAKILALLDELGLTKADDGGPFAVLRQNHGRLLRRRAGATPEVVANGRADWIGWLELTKEPVNELATQHAAMVLREVDAHIQGFVEVENRISLKTFSGTILPQHGGKPFEQVMLIDGNDPRGIDVAIATNHGYRLELMRSHVDDTDATGVIFSRDCPEYQVISPTGVEVTVLVNHLKSKGYGSAGANNLRRLRQAQRVAELYQQRRAEGVKNLVVLGDFNDTLDSAPLAPLAATGLKPAAAHPTFNDGGRPGTFGNCTASENFDHILLAPELFAAVTGGTVYRMGAWGGKNGTLWPHFPTLTKSVEAASDHAAAYVDLDL